MPIKPENRALYPKDWSAIRVEVLGRAKNKCESCGAPNRTWIERYSDGRIRTQLQRYKGSVQVHVVLTIAHLDHDPTNNGEPGNRPNLRALCQQCHNRHDAKTRAEHSRVTRRSKVAAKELF